MRSSTSAKCWRAMPSLGFNCCTNWTFYAHNLNLLCSTLCIVERGSNNCVDFVGLRANNLRILSIHSSLTPGLPLLLRSWTLPVSRKRRCPSLIALSLGGCLLNWVTDFVSKTIPHNVRVPAQSPFHKQLTEKRKDGRLCHLSTEKKLPELHYKLPQTPCG
jgi:hypothetical protein